jgi:hypothetical protein
MNEIITPSIIAALTSLIISIITLFQFFRSQKLQQKQFDKNLSRGLTSKLYDLRIDCYPKAFEITDSIHKLKGGNYDPKIIQTALAELIDWKKGIVSLVISVEALESFIALRDVLMRNPEKKDTYSSTQIENISHRTKEFRKQLRRDIGFLFREEKERRSKD